MPSSRPRLKSVGFQVSVGARPQAHLGVAAAGVAGAPSEQGGDSKRVRALLGRTGQYRSSVEIEMRGLREGGKRGREGAGNNQSCANCRQRFRRPCTVTLRLRPNNTHWVSPRLVVFEEISKHCGDVSGNWCHRSLIEGDKPSSAAVDE